MSGILKGIKKVFRKVVKVVKRVALPALAIAGVVLTGGAALGVFGAAGLSGALGSLGLSAGLSSVLTTAATGATIGAVGSAITGGNILKGASTGFLVGGAAGGLGQLLSPAAGAAGKVGNAFKAGESISKVPVEGLGAGGAISHASSVATPVASAASTPWYLGSPSPAGASTVGAATKSLAPVAAPTAGTSTSALGGLGSFIQQNPLIAATTLQGLGAGISANSAQKAQTKAEEEAYARRQANYGTGGFYTSRMDPMQPIGLGFNQPKQGTWKIDPISGQPYKDYA